jgi:hypothetical protein
MNLSGLDLTELNINLESEEVIALHIELHEELNQD